MKKAILKDEIKQKTFERNGFIKLRLLEHHELKQLQNLCYTYFPDGVEAFFSSSYLDDYDRKLEMSAKVSAIIEEKMNEHFVDFRILGAAFLIKGIGKNSEMPMHQDWTIVDESKYYAANLWIPLTKTDENNGTIEVLLGSHRVNHALRAPTLPFFFSGYEKEIKEKLTVVTAELGEVVLLNQAVIHYSKPNLSNEIRPAVTVGITSKEAPLLFHYWDGQNESEVELFEQEDDFLLRFEDFHEAIYKRPAVGTSKGMIGYDFPKMDDVTLERLVGPKSKPGFFSRIFGAR